MADVTQSQRLKELASRVKLVVFDFDGVMTDNRVLVSQDGKESVFCYRGDGIGILLLKKLNISVIVISKESNPVVFARCKKLDVPCIQSCDDKIGALRKQAGEMKISLDEVAYLGNDINDIECMKEVGFAGCVADSHKDVFKYAVYITKAKGGYGAVREFCDFIVEAKKSAGNYI